MIPKALTIAGSDSGGGAGIQADLKTFAFHQVHGMSAVTCVTAQNTQGVAMVEPMPLPLIQAQLEAVQSDIGIPSLKTGMLLNQQIIHCVAQWLPSSGTQKIVIDPVMVSRTGAVLLEADAITAIQDKLLPHALITTPNVYEAELLTGTQLKTQEDVQNALQQIHRMGAQNVLIKGGGFKDDKVSKDFWFDGKNFECLETEYVSTPHTHGTGCTLGAAISANLALGFEPLSAVRKAKQYVTRALKYSLAIGHGQGPVGHWHPLIPD